MLYVDCVRTYAEEPGIFLEEAVDKAVRDCIDKGILAEFLRRNRAEAISVSIFEYNEAVEKEKLRKAEFQGGYDAGYDEGYDSGYDEGYVSGVTEGIEALITTCKELGISYEQTSDKVREKYALTGEEVQQNMQKYW